MRGMWDILFCNGSVGLKNYFSIVFQKRENWKFLHTPNITNLKTWVICWRYTHIRTHIYLFKASNAVFSSILFRINMMILSYLVGITNPVCFIFTKHLLFSVILFKKMGIHIRDRTCITWFSPHKWNAVSISAERRISFNKNFRLPWSVDINFAYPPTKKTGYIHKYVYPLNMAFIVIIKNIFTSILNEIIIFLKSMTLSLNSKNVWKNGSYGSKDQLLINKMLLQNCCSRNKNLRKTYTDYKTHDNEITWIN